MLVMVKLEISENEGNQRLDKFLRKYLGNAPLSFIYKAIRKDVKVNGKRKTREYMLEAGDEVSLYLTDQDLEKFRKVREHRKVKRTFGIAYEDENILAAVKPKNLLTHGDRNERRNHLTNQVIDYLIEKGDYVPRLEKTFVPAPVNRLDRNTTGLVLFAKNYPALQAFTKMIRERGSIRKYYLTIVSGEMKEPLALEDRMEKDEARDLVRVTDREDGKLMKTFAEPVAAAGGFTLCRIEIETGRTHQIRVQLANAGFPIIGDGKYGSPRVNRDMKNRYRLTTQLLHAYQLQFENCPAPFDYLNGKTVTAELPKGFREIRDDIFTI